MMQRIYQFLGVDIHSDADRTEFRTALKEGVKSVSPSAAAMFIWAVVTAVAMIAAGMPWYYVVLTNLFVYAASAQLAVLSMLMVHAPLPIIWLAAAVVNLRFVIFSAGIRPYFRHMRLPQRLLYGFMNTDVGSIMFPFRYRNVAPAPATREQLGFYWGMNTTLFCCWQIGCAAGMLFASFLPMTWGLDLAAALTLLALVIKGVDHWAGVVSCMVALVVAVLLQDLPYKLWVLVAIVVAVAVALVVETLLPQAYLKPRKN